MLTLSHGSELLRTLGDPTRVRLLHLLAAEELTVAELTRATRLSQSRVSTHLGRLKEAGLVRDRRDGQASYYSLCPEDLAEDAQGLWAAFRERTCDPLLEQDRERLRAMLDARGQSWADSVAGQMERHYSPGRTWEGALRGLLGLVRLGDVLDVASGDGALAELIAPRARTITCLDISPGVVEAGRSRLAHLAHVRFHRADMHALPFAHRSFDQVLLMNSLSYATDPGRVLSEAARVLRPGGDLACVALRTHQHADVSARYGHRQSGFEPDSLRDELEARGLTVSVCSVTARERRSPHFEVVTAHAARPGLQS